MRGAPFKHSWNYFTIIFYHPSNYFSVYSLPPFIPFPVPLLSVCPCLCAVSSEIWDFWCTGSFCFLQSTLHNGSEPILDENIVLLHNKNNNTLHTHTHICSLIIFKFREKCELSDTLIKNILGGVACVFLVYFVVIIPLSTRDFIQNFTVFFIFLEHGWSLANTLSGPESCSCPISWIFSIICMIFVSKLLNHIHTIESSPTPNRKTD